MFVIVELLYGNHRRESKKNDKASTISSKIISLKIEEIRICVGSF
jgi:hypothetical protein